MSNVENMRELFYSMKIGEPEEYIWIKKLRNILNSDIHNRPLGCKINDTHIKIGDVHLSSFYEAQILFSHSKWIHRFAEWLVKELSVQSEDCLIVGYETYIEPVLSVLKNTIKIDYCIYEEPKYIQRNTMSKSRLRYSERIQTKNANGKTYKKVVFLCGISSTLSTYKKLEEFYCNVFNVDKSQVEMYYYSIVQVLPEVSETMEFLLNDTDKLTWNKSKKKAYRNDICVKYLVDVECEWQTAKTCKWCFPKDNLLDERPLITTGESSVIPLQMIGCSTKPADNKTNVLLKDEHMNFFHKSNGKFEYLDYLYYNHIDRDDHHYQYYIRTGALFNKIIDTETSEKFENFCKKIKKELNLSDECINIIVTPLHFSNERFSHEINRLVFDNKAHIISFDARKEYRSNFETKYSNYAYILEQINSNIKISDDNYITHKINFYFVDDQLITGNTFFRAKSFASSLMRKYSKRSDDKSSYQIFNAVITLIDRNSNSTKFNYVEKLCNFFSFINIPIPSIRNYGDSCPLCKQIMDSQMISDNCTLEMFSKYWEEKVGYHRKKTIEEAKQLSLKTPRNIRNRQFIRFYCEYTMWTKIKHLWDEHQILSAILLTIYDEIKKLRIKEQYEYLISFLKIISRPFLLYRENVKKAVLKILLLVLTEMLKGEKLPAEIIIGTIKKAEKCEYIKKVSNIRKPKSKPEDTNVNVDYERYSLICILISCLSSLESSYMLNVDNISTLCDFVAGINSSFITFSKLSFDDGIEMSGFYSTVVNNFKKLICGISGIEKSKVIENQLVNNFNDKYSELFKILYLENIRFTKDDQFIQNEIEEIQHKQENTILKYESIGTLCKKHIKVDSCLFFLSSGETFEKSKVAEIFKNTRIGNFSLIFDKMRYNTMQPKMLYDSLNKIGCFEFNYQHFLIMLSNQSMEGKENNNKFVFMLLSFKKSTPTNYSAVKKWLIHRKTLTEIIKDDIKTGALESAIRAKAAEYVLSTDKTQSHGQSSDINRLFEFVYEKFINARKKSDEQIISAYQGINLFINRCIAFGATKQIFQEYFDLNNVQRQLQPFNACIQEINDTSEMAEVNYDLKRYLEIIIQNNSKYLNQIKEEVVKKRKAFKETEEQVVNISISEQPNILSGGLKYVPLFIDAPSDFANSAIFLIGIIDVFIRNAIEHGLNHCDIEIKCAHGEDVVENKEIGYKYNDSYSISVINNCFEDEFVGEGFTKKFFTQYLYHEKNKHTFFYITMEKISNNKFESKLICVVKDLPEDIL